MTVNLYAIAQPQNKINKDVTNTIKASDINIDMKKDTSIMSPIILLKFPSGINETNFNYAKLSNGYYYFVTDVIKKLGGIHEVHLEIDVLTSFKTQINNITCEIVRCEKERNKDIVDDEVPLVSTKNVEVMKFDGQFFDTSKCRYYLCVSGG